MSGVSLANQTRQISDDLDALDALDISQVKGDLFLDGCKVSCQVFSAIAIAFSIFHKYFSIGLNIQIKNDKRC